MNNSPQVAEKFAIGENINLDEKTYGNLKFLNFERMSHPQEVLFKELVQQSRGTVQVWIHSHYDENREFTPKSEEYKKLRDRAMSSSSTDKMPVIAFIEAPKGFEDNIDYYGNEYSKLTKGSIYYVPTFQDSSVPYFLNKQDYAVTSHQTEILNWDYLGSKLAGLGVKNVIIRGRNFEYKEIDRNNLSLAQDIFAEKKGLTHGKVDLPDKCAGAAVVQLEARGFNVLPSRVAYPEHLK